MKRIILLISFFVFNVFLIHSKITINELMSKNVSYKMYQLDNVYGFAGFVELHNGDSDSIDLKGYQFLDHKGHSWKCNSSVVIPPDSFIVIWFSELNKKNHVSFKLDAEGGTLIIKNANGEIVDELEYPEGKRNLSYGSIDDGKENAFFTTPSLGVSNKGAHVLEIMPSIPSFNYNAGFYSESIKLEITSDEDCEIHFTTNGSEPTISDSLYTKPLDLNKNTVVKAISVKKIEIDSLGSLKNDFHLVKSDPVTSTYFIGERDIKLPIVSLSTDSFYLFDEEYGIYVVGNGRYPKKNTGWASLTSANYWGDEKRPINIEFFDTTKKQQINQEIGVGIYGGYSRSYDKKSLKLNPSKIYGDKQFRYKLFESKPNLKLKSILLRSSGNDYCHSYLRDGFISSLVENCIDVDMSAYTPCAVYLNGNYFGLMNLRERHNDDYIYSNYGLDEDSIVQSLNKSKKYAKLKKYDINSDTAKTLIYSLFDINEILNFTLTEIYCANNDWGTNNIIFWSRMNDDDEYWRVILYDTDAGFSNFGDKSDLNTISYAYKNSVLAFLLGNNEIRNKFITKAIVHLATTFDPIRVEHILDSLSSTIKDEAIFYQNFREKGGLPTSNWESEISKMHGFAKVRPNNVFAHLKDYYSLGDTSSIILFADEKGTEFYLNDEIVKTNCFNSYCFEGFEIVLKCSPPDGFLFDHWEISTGDSVYTSFEDELTTVFTEESSYHAILKKDINNQTFLPNLYLNEICVTNKMYIDEYRESDDWIEIYNASSFPVDLGGMYLSDKKGNPTKYMIPLDAPEKTTVAGKSYIVFWADNAPDQGPNHLGFSLSSSKRQTVTLSTVVSDSVIVIDSISYEIHDKGETYARFSYDDNLSWIKTKWPTFASSNRILGYDMTKNYETADTLNPPIITGVETSLISICNNKAAVYPNPTKDVIYVSFPCESASYIIYNNGLSCKKGFLKNGRQIDLTDLSSGLYILSLWNAQFGFYNNIKIIKR